MDGTEGIKYLGRTNTNQRIGSSNLSILLKQKGNVPSLVQKLIPEGMTETV